MRRAERALLGVCFTIGLCVHAHAAPPHGTMTLSDAYRLALRQSEQVQIAVGNRNLADAQYTDQLTLMGPTVTGSVRATRENEATGAVPGQVASVLQSPYNIYAAATISQPIFRRQIFDARRAAALGVESTSQTLARARQQLMFDVATAFIGVLQARTQVGVAQGAIKRAEATLAIVKNRVKIGTNVPVTLLPQQIELARAQISVNTAEGALRQQESTFERLVGQVPPDVLALPPTPSREAVEEAMQRSHEDRADLRALHYAAEQARTLVASLRDKIFWPTLDAVGTGGYTVYATSSTGALRYPTYGITGVLTVPIFQTGDEWLQVRLQKERAYVAAYQESFLRRQVGDDIRRAVARLETADKAIEIATDQQKTAENYYQSVLGLTKLGSPYVTPLDALTAQGAIFEADTNRAVAQYEREIATYQLLFAEGKINL